MWRLVIEFAARIIGTQIDICSQCIKSKSRARSNRDFGVIYASSMGSGKQTHLNIRHSAKITCACSYRNLCARSEGSGESEHLHRLTRAFVTASESHVHAWLAAYVPFMRAVNALVNLHNVAQVHLSLLSLVNLKSTKLHASFGSIYDCSEWSGESVHLHRLTSAFVTVPKSYALAQMTMLAVKALLSLHQQIQQECATTEALFQCF